MSTDSTAIRLVASLDEDAVLRDAPFEPLPAPRRLAAITDFDLFVTTTFDSLLENAINLERLGGGSSTEALSHAPNRVVDLPAERDRLTHPVVYHLFGKLSASPTYAISDEDLEAAGITTWFDIDRPQAGDDYDRKIQRNIQRSSYFIPVISATTQSRLEGYVRREWSYALDRARNMADGALFILPVVLDETTAAGAHVPERFKALHFTQLPGGEVTAEFAQRLAEFLRGRNG